MTRRSVVLGLTFLFSAKFSPAAGAGIDWTVRLRRVGPVGIGMSIDEVRRTLQDPNAHLVGPDCAYLDSDAIPKSLGFMFQKGRLVRIDISGPEIRTASGAGVGDSEEKIQQLYPGRIGVESNRYGHYLKYTPADEKDRSFGMVFETENNQVTTFRVGTVEAITIVGGCA